MTRRDVELLAIGAGPSNLGLAVALEELAPELAEDSLIIERNQTIEWQTGMLLPWTKSQVPFLKDLVTLRNPRSKFSFLSHLHATGRLDDFINMGSFLPYRVEISEYLGWVASSLSRVTLELGQNCVSIAGEQAADGTLSRWLTTLADGTVIASRYLVIGTGRDAYIPPVLAGLPTARVIHSSRYRPGIADLSTEKPWRVALIGASQSAAEMFSALRHDLPKSDVSWLIRSVSLTADQSSKFSNELYFPSYIDSFFASGPPVRERILKELYKTNYSCITPPMLEELYTHFYLDGLAGRSTRRLSTMVEVTAARESGDELELELTDRNTGRATELRRDLVFLGTGFTWQAPRLVRQLAEAIGLDQVLVNRRYQLVLNQPATAACYLQGISESTHGIGDSLLSVLAHRAQDITLDILAHRLASRVCAAPGVAAEGDQ
jgi:L-ornithine N5-monooxygenase